VEAAKQKALELPNCKGFCFAGEETDGLVEVFFKNKWDINASGSAWTSYRIETSRTALEQRVEVNRLSTGLSGRGWRIHDRRALEISRGNLLIFDKGSTVHVKAAIDVANELDQITLMPGGILSLALCKLPSGADADNGVVTQKSYFFEFPSARRAKAFYDALQRLREQ